MKEFDGWETTISLWFIFFKILRRAAALSKNGGGEWI